MSVELDPPELGFKRPFTSEVSEILRLRNPHSDPVAFKVKTTAPKQYCVRPNSGRIEPGKDVEVQVLLQAMKEDPPPDAKCRDKFLVQSVAVAADSDADNVASIWSHIESTAKSSIQEKKIRVIFLPSDGSAATPHRTVNGIGGAQHDGTPSQRSPSPEAVTPRHSSNVPVASYSNRASTSSVGAGTGATDGSSSGGQQTMMGAAAASLPSSDDMKRQLDEAKSTIARLQQQASEGLRQRKPETSSGEKGLRSSGSTSMGVQQTPAGGVPVQIVAALCLLSFLLAYFFF
ncbi:hypothetical protein LTS18_000047 [Coniosporium uncinatum]|uniref:Uncharacterized protein n=1 Tax=Coniosporium uncinatum TaxID=93489 RepID=A0ACC3DDP3_9PEZI|nr:hypothetical protein LTS18_000047 [Coniosporium uncinatum]